MTREHAVIRTRSLLLIGMIVVATLAIGVGPSLVAAGIDSTNRSIDAQEAEPGEVVQVTTTFEIGQDGERVSLEEDFNPEFELVKVDDVSLNGDSSVIDDTSVKDASQITIAAEVNDFNNPNRDFQAGDVVTVKYRVQLPDDAQEGDVFSFSGRAGIDDSSDVTISGDDTIQVNIPEPDISVTGYDVEDTAVAPGEAVTVEAILHNAGGAAGDTEVTFFIDGSEAGSEVVSVGAEDTETVRFTTSFDALGTYEVTIDEFAPTEIAVREPADIEVTEYRIAESVISSGETIDVEATVENAGELTDRVDVGLSVDGEVVDSQSVSVGGGETRVVTLSTEIEDPGTYDVTVGDLDSTPVTVLGPAEVAVTDYVLERTRVAVDEEMAIEATVENLGDESGDVEATVLVDGTAVDSDVITVGPSDSATVALTTSFAQPGTYEVSVNGLPPTEITVEELAQIEIVGIELAEPEIRPGAELTAAATVENTGEGSGDTVLTLSIDGTPVANESITVDAGATETVELSTVMDESGRYTVHVNDVDAGVVEVAAPADTRVTSVDVGETAVDTGDDVTVEATIENRGDKPGEHEVILYVDGAARQSVTVSVEGNTAVSLAFTVPLDEAATYEVSVNEGDPIEVTATGSTDTEGDPLPGFGPIAMLAALAAAGYLVVRRRG